MAYRGLTLAGMTADYIGSRVRVTVPDGQYEGCLYAIDLNGQRITLEKITSCKTGKQINGVQNFFNYEITNLQIITDNRKKADKKRDDCDGPLLVGRKQTNPHLRNLKTLDRERSLLKSGDSKKPKEGQEVDEGPRITRVKTLQEAQRKVSTDTLNHQKWPEHYLVIGQNNNVFKEALIHIQAQTVIGVALEGVKLGRHGQISFIQVGTRSYVFIFDVLALGMTLFDEGLKAILEHEKIQKVINDCRWVSDALFHQYGVRLCSVFDTQVASVMCYRNEHNGEMPRYVQALNTLLIRYLEMPSNHVYFYSKREQVESDQKVWLSRPAPERLVKVAMRHAMYLLALRAALLEAMLIDFTDGIDIYLGVVRDAPEDKVSTLENHTLPYQFRNMNTEARKMRSAFENRYQTTSELENMRGPHGFRENCIGSLDTNIIFSHDSVWHEGDGKHVQGLSRTQLLEECHRKGTYFMAQEGMKRDMSKAKDIVEYRQFTAKAKAAEADELLLSLGKKEPPKTNTQTVDSQTAEQDQPILQVGHTTYVPAGCQASSVEFRSRDVRVTKPDVLRVEQDSDSDDTIPSHQSLVKANPTRHKPASGAGPKPAWGLDTGGNNGINTSQARTAPAGVNGTETRQHVPRGRGLGCQVLNGHGSASDGRSSSDSTGMKGVSQPERATPPKVALGRSKLLMQMLAESGKIGGVAR